MSDNDIVISGMSGRFAESNNIDELAKNVFAGVSLVTETDGRWPENIFGLNTKMGKIKDLNLFDADFFKMGAHLAQNTRPELRKLLEVTYEAIIDAGINPNSLQGTKTGVYVGVCGYPGSNPSFETFEPDLLNKRMTMLNSWMANIQSYLANRISFVYDLKGPSSVTDTACSASFTALNMALTHLQTGQTDYAIVAGAHLNLDPVYLQIFQECGACSATGISSVMDESADGFVKSDAISCVLLQRRSTAKRVYSTLLTARVNNDGRKGEGIYHPSSKAQEELFVMTYKEAGIDPLKLTYVEAHLTGTKVGDPLEMKAIYNAYCSRPGRKEILPIGSMKSITGHSEAASGIASLIKVILCYETETIPPNINLNQIKKEIKEFCPPLYANLKLMKYEPGLVAINNFGIGSVNANVLVEPNYKLTNEDNFKIAETIPRIINICGRTEDAVKYVFDFIEQNPQKITRDFLALLTDIMKNELSGNTNNFSYKDNSDIKYEYKKQMSQLKSRSLRQVWFLFPGLGGQWSGMAKALMPIKVFANKVEECHQILSEFKIDLKHLLLSEDKSVMSSMTAKFCATTSLQIALFEVLKALDITPDGIIGHSFGEIACAYADGCLSTRDAMIVAFFRGFVTETEKNIGTGLMAVCALNKFEAKKLIPTEVVIACYNDKNTVVLSGPQKQMKQIIEKLKQKAIFCAELESNGIAFHSKYLKDSTKQMTELIKQYLKNPKKRSNKWISTSIVEKEPKDDILNYASAEYFVNNLISPVFFYDQFKNVPSNAIVVEIGAHGVFKRIVSDTLESAQYLNLIIKDSNETNLDHFLSSIATLYELGLNPSIENLYPKVEFPVSRGTPSISSLMKWDHSVEYPLRLFPNYLNKGRESEMKFIIDLNEHDDSFYSGHRVDGTIIFPGTGYLMLAWRTMAHAQGKTWNEVPIILEDIQFIRTVQLTDENKTSLKVLYDRNLGNFSVTEDDHICCFGKIRSQSEETLLLQELIEEKQNSILENEFSLSSDDIYKDLQIMGYNYSQKFRKLKKIGTKDFKNFNGISEWNGNMVAFLDTLGHSMLISGPFRRLSLAHSFKKVRIDPKVFLKAVAKNRSNENLENIVNIDGQPGQFDVDKVSFFNQEEFRIEERFGLFRSELPFYYNSKTKLLVSPGIEVEGLNMFPINGRVDTKNLVLDSYEFLPNDDNNAIEEYDKRHINEYLQVCKSMATQLKQIAFNDKKFHSIEQNLSIDLIERYRNQNNEKHVIFKILDKFKDSTTLDMAFDGIQTDIGSIDNDLVNTVSKNERLIRSLTDIVSENNVTKRELKVTEINLSSDLFVEELEKNMTNFKTMTTVVDYQLIVNTIEGISEKLHDYCQVWDIKEDLHIDVSDLIILRDTQQIWELSLQKLFKQIVDSLSENGFLLIITKYQLTEPEVVLNSIIKKNLSFEKRLEEMTKVAQQMGIQLIANKCDTISTKALLFRKIEVKKKIPTNDQIIEITADRNKKWFDLIKENLNNRDELLKTNTVWLIARDSNINGVIGLINCLRLEPEGLKMRCIFDFDQRITLPIDWKSKPFSDILRNDLAVNVIKDGKLGTYRHLRLPKDYDKTVSNEYFLNISRIGDLSSLQWFGGRNIVVNKEYYGLRNMKITQVIVNIYCSGLIFADVMIASGRIAVDREYPYNDCMIGWEFAGRRADTGERVMGIDTNRCFATNINANVDQMTTIPKHWSMEEAVTILIQYLTVWYGLIERADLKKGESILIHSGCGGVGQAVINICKHYECDIFVTVGSEEKKLFLINEYNIPENRIFSSRDILFKYRIEEITEGKGVDIVVNSLAGELLDASLSCLAKSGRFIELGKYDLMQNKQLGTHDFLRDISFIGVTVDLCIRENPGFCLKFFDWMHRNATNGCVKPLNRKVFEANEAEKAFRYMTTGKHIGKIVIKIREEENNRMPLVNIEPAQEMLTTTKTYFNPNKVYIITGGLGGFGMELVQWMSNRGAKKFVLTSRTGFKNDYQKYVINRMIKFGEYLKYFNVKIQISKNDCLSVESTQRVISNASQLGQIGGIFNLTLILNDCLLQNMTFEMFCESIDTKHKVCAHLDIESRKLGYNLDYFVVFSSQSCGKGMPGQTNYGFGNSLCERICEQRRVEGLHGLAIQYGPIDDVGALESTDEYFLTSLQKQRINSCCDVLDKLLAINKPIVTSYVTANREMRTEKDKKGLIQNLWNALGIDTETTPDHLTLKEIGVESILAVELQHELERALGVKYSTADLGNLTVGFLKEYERGMTSTTKKNV